MGSWKRCVEHNTAAAGTGCGVATVTNSATQQFYRAKAVNPFRNRLRHGFFGAPAKAPIKPPARPSLCRTAPGASEFRGSPALLRRARRQNVFREPPTRLPMLIEHHEP